MASYCYTVLAMVRGDLDLLPSRVENLLNDQVRGTYSDDSDNWKPFGDNVPICELVERVGDERGAHFTSLSHELIGNPSPEALFRVFVMTDVYIIDCLSLEHRRIADLARKIDLAAHRSAAFFVPFDFDDEMRKRMRGIWKQKLPLLDFASAPSDDLARWRNRYIYRVPFKEDLKRHLKTVLEDLDRTRKAGWPGAGQPTPRGHLLVVQSLAQQQVAPGFEELPRMQGYPR